MKENNEDSLDSYKIVLVGEPFTGKTSIVNYFTTNSFDGKTKPTISATFAQKSILIKEIDKTINFNIWDTAGQESYRSLTKLFYNNAKAAILVYDITNRKSFEEIKNYWYNEIKDNSPDAVKYI
jgi:small GTP-binding protein